MYKYINFSWLTAFLLVVAATAGHAAELASFSVQKKQEVITLSVPDVTPRKIFTVTNPDRLVVDVPSVPGRNNLSLPPSYKGKLVKAARFGQFDPTTSRFVFDLQRPITVVGTKTSSGKKTSQLMITIAEADKKGSVQNITVGKDGKESKARTKAKPSTADIALETKKEPNKDVKPLIVIDPGHGGVDPGTIGPRGTQEKDIVLAYALALKNKLLKTGRYKVKLTRENDGFIMLRQRVAIARKAGGVVFISLHADSAPEQMARGLSVYTVSEKASDQEAEALAARENKADVLAGMDLSEEQQDVADILISLAQRETKNSSATLADLLVSRLGSKIQLLPNSHRFAGFAVLKAPDIPSVLIETGFLSNPKEEKLLNSKAYREKVINGIVSGVDAYFAQQKSAGL